jgi:hypothetical protein
LRAGIAAWGLLKKAVNPNPALCNFSNQKKLGYYGIYAKPRRMLCVVSMRKTRAFSAFRKKLYQKSTEKAIKNSPNHEFSQIC